LEVLEIFDFSFFLILIIVFLLLTKKMYKETGYVYLMIMIPLIYIPIGTFTYQMDMFDDRIFIVFFNLVLTSIIFMSIGMTVLNYKVEEFATDSSVSHKMILTGLGLLFFNQLVLGKMTASSQVLLGVFFLVADISRIFFWGGLGILIKSNNPRKYQILLMYLIIFIIPNIIKAVLGEEFSRFSLVLLAFYGYIVFNEIFHNKKIISFITFASVVTLGMNINIFGGGDLLIVRYGMQIVQAVYTGAVDLKPGLIPFNMGFNIMPDPFHIKPKLFTINASYFMYILGWSFEQTKKYPFGLGVTGIADSYWSIGYYGTMFWFFMAGLYIGYLKKLAYTYQSGLAYGLYISQIASLFLLYRLDFSFFFGRLLIALPILLYLIKVKKL